MDSLFDLEPTNTYEPLPVRMRPTKLDHLYGQEKAVGRGPSRYGRKGIPYHLCFFMGLVERGKHISRYHC